MCFKADFDSPNDVVPVSDPEIFSELQRIAQMQTIAQRAQLFPQLYDQHKVEEGILKMMKVKDPTQYLNPKPTPKPEHAINENIAAALGQPIIAFPDQDHLAHIQCHLSFLEDPMFGKNPLMAAQAIPGIIENVKQHMLFWYGMEIFKVATEANNGKDISQYQQINDPDVKTAFDQLLAAATQKVSPTAQQIFAKVPSVIAAAQALLKQYQPPQPMDPSVVAQQKVQADTQAKQAEVQVKQQQLQQDAQSTAQEMQLEAQKAAMQHAQVTAQQQLDASTAAGEAQGVQQKTQADNSTKLQVTTEDNNTAMEIAAAEIAAGHKSNIKDGAAIGGKPRTT
jgi:hypothetical protein